MTGGRALLRDERGASMVEMAFALPIMILAVYGIFVGAMIFQANAGMQHALGEGARLATIFPVRDNDAIKAEMDAKVFGTSQGVFTASVSDGAASDNCDAPADVTNVKTLRVTYKQPVNLLFFQAPDVSLSRCKTVYVPV